MRDEMLSTLCLAPPAAIWALVGFAAVLGTGICGRIMARTGG